MQVKLQRVFIQIEYQEQIFIIDSLKDINFISYKNSKQIKCNKKESNNGCSLDIVVIVMNSLWGDQL